jgi:hypothetical protein
MTDVMHKFLIYLSIYFCRLLHVIAGSNPRVCMDVCLLSIVLPGRRLWDGLITRPEESYRL